MAERASDPVVRLKGIHHVYGRVTALDGVDLELPAGRMSGLIGPDGVGKSTLIGVIAGVRRIQAGQVEVLGQDLRQRRLRNAVFERIAYMPQGLGRNLYPTLSVRENLDFFGRLFGQDRAARDAHIAELTAATGLTRFLERPAMNLSGGMKQKLGLCCALIHDPDLVILDEPTTGVDPLSRRRFWELIERLRQRRPELSLLVSTAYMDEAQGFDHLVAMDAGQVLACGSLEELRARTGERDMEEVFVALLPAERRGGHRRLQVPPRVPRGDESPAIRAEGLTRRFGDFTAVDRITIAIQKGEIFGFLGSNGCGKTTTMRMLTGLLPATAGQAWVFDQPVGEADTALRRRLGFMSQAFSLYGELTVAQNLDLHARLYRLPAEQIPARIAALTTRFDLERYRDARAQELPLGVRQRLSLAVAVIHEPELLILDEPTSGVDPVARDLFWEQLIVLSRQQGVTLFISTHFMNEAERCDRLSLMNAGRILAQDTPAALKAAQGAATLEDAFIAYMEQAAAESGDEAPAGWASAETGSATAHRPASPTRFSVRRLWAFARREAAELRRDAIRLAFALLGPIILMIAMGFGISFDVDEIKYAVLDRDRSPASREYVEQFAGSAWFSEQAPLVDDADKHRRLASGKLHVAIEIPPAFGRDLERGARPEVGFLVDAANPNRGDTIRGYVEGVHREYLDSRGAGPDSSPVQVETRFRYNQEFDSVFAMVPSVIMLLLIVIPATMTAVGVVREKELGSIDNLYSTPTTGAEFLLGKQLPYVGLALLSYLTLLLMAVYLFRVPVTGSLGALTLGAVLFVFASTGLGLLMSTFMDTQIAAVFGTAIASTVPTTLFSGMLVPLSSLTGSAQIMGYGFPSAWFNHVSVGTFTKALTLGDLWLDYLVLGAFGLGFFLLGLALLPSQER